jgi:hypothetical protein
MAQFTEFKRRQFEWYDIVRLTGEDGCRWMDRYNRHRELVSMIADSLPLLRRGDIQQGERMLACADEILTDSHFEDPAIRAVAERWFYGALGYCLYVRRDFDAADAAMARAHEAVAGALDHDFLIFLADETVDFRMHRARIARERQRWRELRDHVEVALAMRAGEIPYYTLPTGRTVHIEDVRAFLNGLPVEEGALVAPHLQVETESRRNIEVFAREVLRIPGFVIAQT